MGKKGFTLIELLVVIGLITVLVALLLPAITRARAVSQQTVCQNNIRQILVGLTNYASRARGWYPPNINATPTRWWSDAARMGRLLTPSIDDAYDLRGPAVVCPADDGVRSYAMNLWASSLVDSKYLDPKTGGRYGTLWRPWCKLGSKLILVTEAWSSSGTVKGGYYAAPTIGGALVSPGARFGGGTIVPYLSGRFGNVVSDLTYSRHRLNRGPGVGNQPIGVINIGFADSHVERKLHTDLYDPISGRSTLECLWSPDDYLRNN